MKNNLMNDQSETLNVLTLNVWGLPSPIAKDKEIRMKALGERLSEGEFDLVALQEVWDGDARESIKQMAGQGGLAHSHYFHSGVMGSGLLILSRYPIEAIAYHRYSVNGKPYKPYHGDYFGGKGVGLVRVNTPLGMVDLYTTHLTAKYNEPDEYDAHRLSQVVELVNFIDATARGNLQLVVGDMNSPPESLAYQFLRAIGNLEDSFGQLYPNEPGYTHSAENKYNTDEISKVDFMNSERIDYVFYRMRDVEAWHLSDSAVVLKAIPIQIHHREIPYSDHFGVYAQFSAHSNSELPSISSNTDTEAIETLTAALTTVEGGITDATNRRRLHRIAFVAFSLIPIAVASVSFIKGAHQTRSLPSNLLFFLAITFFLLLGLVEFWLGFLVTTEELNALREGRAQLQFLIENCCTHS